MNKIINQKRYDTKTAKCIGEWDNRYPQNDFSYICEELYIKKTGEYFLYGKGGAMSKYSQSSGNSTTGGEIIKPLSLNDAKAWAEKKLTGEEYKSIFGEIEEDNPSEGKEKILVTLSSDTIKNLKEKKETTGANVSWLIEKSLKDAGY